MLDQEKLLAATKAAYQELWPDDDFADRLSPPQKAGVAFNRQQAIDRTAKAIEAYGQSMISTSDPQKVVLAMPEDLAMVQQVLATVVYLDKEGVTSYAVVKSGEGLMSTWLGMGVLTQDYLLQQHRIDWQNGPEGEGE